MPHITDVPFLTRLRPQYAQFLTKESKNRKVAKKTIIDDMFALYIEQQEKESIKKSYMQMANDTEYLSECQYNAGKYLSHH